VADINKFTIISSYPIFMRLGPSIPQDDKIWEPRSGNWLVALYFNLEKSSLPKKFFCLVIPLSQKQAMG
jgi:hypothetical protein